MLEKIKSIQFVMIVSFVSSLLLAFVAMSLKPSIDKNIILDKKQSILSWMAAGSNLRFWTAHAQGAFSNTSLNKDGSVTDSQTGEEIEA